MRLPKWIWGVVSFALLFSLCASSQSTSEIRGTVTSSSGQPVVSAFVILTGDDTGSLRAASTDEAGAFEFTAVPVATYQLQIKADGFTTFDIHGVRASIGRVVNLKIRLSSGTEEAFEVRGNDAPMVETTNAQLGVVMSDLEVGKLPLKSRDTFELLQLQPGVQSTLGADLFYGNDRPGVVSVNGGRSRSNNYEVNGGHAGEQFSNMPSIQPSPDTVREFRVLTHNYDAEYGRNSGSVLNVVTKSGSNQFHGSLYEYFRNRALNAKGYFDAENPDFKQNEFGGAFGGPIHSQKTFFFASYEGRRLRRGIASDPVLVPSTLERTGDFSAGPMFEGVLQDQTVADVLNNRPGCAAAVMSQSGMAIAPGTPYATLFAGNMIPRECFDATSADLLGYVPTANSTDGFFQASPVASRRHDQVSLRIDHNLTAQQQLHAYYYGDDSLLHEPFARQQGSGANLPGFGSQTRARFQQLNVGHGWTVNAKTVNDLRLVYYRDGEGSLLTPENTNLVSSSCSALEPQYCFSDPSDPRLGITPGLGDQREGLPFISVAGSFAIGNNPNGSFSQTGNMYQVTDTLSKILGSHTLKFGVDLRNQRLHQIYFYNLNGDIEFTGGGPNDVGYSNLLPNYLLGLPDMYSQGAANSEDVRATFAHLFVQDTWKLRNNVVLSYGLRWELNTPQADASGRVQAFRPGAATSEFNCVLSASNPLASEFDSSDCSQNGDARAVFPLGLVFPGDPGISNGLTEMYKKSFAPRLGITWSPQYSEGLLARITGGPGRSSIRAGWGMFYDSNEELILSSFAAQPPFGGSTFLTNVFLNTPFLGQDGTINPNPFDGMLAPARGSDVDFSIFRPIQLYGNFPKQLPSQYAVQYHLTLQRELTNDMMLQLGYVGSQGHRLLATIDQNYGNAQACLDLNQIPGMSCGPFGADNAYYISAGSIPAGVTLHLPYGSVPSITGPNASDITLVGLRRYSSPLCEPTTGEGCPPDGVPVFSSIFSTEPVANSSYNSLQALLSKRFKRSLQMVASYTWSKSFDNASSYENSVNPIDPSLSRSLSLFDSRHRFIATYYWVLPEWKPSNFVRHLTTGWATSGIVTLQSGFPIRITSGSDTELMTSIDYETPGQPDLVAPFRTLDPRASGGYYFDPASFAEPALGTIGNAPRTICCGPGLANLDVALHKTVPIREKSQAEFRLEIFNLFNHTQFMNPDGNLSNGDTFGIVRRARDPRLMQLALRLSF